MQISPSCFYAQKLCFRSLEQIFAECAVAYNDSGDRRLSLSTSLTIIRRVIDVVSAAHALGFVVLDANPSSFCEGERGDIASLQLVDMKNVMKLEPKTYSTPASFVTKSGGRFGVPTGLFAMVPHSSLFLGHLHANCFYAAPEVLKTPGSVSCASDVFSIASILVWCVTGAAPCVHMSRDLLGLGCYSDNARALVPSLISSMHEPVQHGDHLVRRALLTLFVCFNNNHLRFLIPAPAALPLLTRAAMRRGSLRSCLLHWLLYRSVGREWRISLQVLMQRRRVWVRSMMPRSEEELLGKSH
jgi:hypothetical protein